eukprot:4149662-Alexandrium_andersonii.AAC.1
MPASLQRRAVSRNCRLCSSYRSAALPGASAELARKPPRSPEVTAKSSAAGSPLRQRGMKTSAGRQPESSRSSPSAS